MLSFGNIFIGHVLPSLKKLVGNAAQGAAFADAHWPQQLEMTRLGYRCGYSLGQDGYSGPFGSGEGAKRIALVAELPKEGIRPLCLVSSMHLDFTKVAYSKKL